MRARPGWAPGAEALRTVPGRGLKGPRRPRIRLRSTPAPPIHYGRRAWPGRSRASQFLAGSGRGRMPARSKRCKSARDATAHSIGRGWPAPPGAGRVHPREPPGSPAQGCGFSSERIGRSASQFGTSGSFASGRKSDGGGDDALGVEAGARLQHVVDGAGHLGGEDGVAPELAVLGHQPLGVGRQQGVVALGQNRGLPEGPAQIGVAHLAAAEPLHLPGAGHGALHQPAVAEEVLRRGEPRGRIHFKEDRQRQHPAHPRHRQQQLVVAALVRLGQPLGFLVELADLPVVGAHDLHVAFRPELVQRVRVLLQDPLLPHLPVAAALGGRHQPLRGLLRRHVREHLRPPPDVAHPLPQQRAHRPPLRRIDVGRRDQVRPQQVRELLRVHPVVLVLAPVDVREVQRVGQHELEARREARVRQPVPVERALADHRQVVAVRLRQLQEMPEVVAPDVLVDQDLALGVQDARVHLFRMQIDSAVEFRRRRVILHLCLSSLSALIHWDPRQR